MGGWTKSGDKYSLDRDGYYVYGGRSDDMLKVFGHLRFRPPRSKPLSSPMKRCSKRRWVGAEDERAKPHQAPRPFVVLKQGNSGTDALKAALQQHVKGQSSRPTSTRAWIEFSPRVAEDPRRGKIQRFKLRS